MDSRSFVGWEEVVINNDKGKRAVNYYVKDSGGRRELAVVGREKSLRHMAYMVTGSFFKSAMMATGNKEEDKSAAFSGLGFGRLKWKSRREVVDWLSGIVSDSGSSEPSKFGDLFLDNDDVAPGDNTASKDLSSGVAMRSKDFTWLGSAWNCRKRRKHYRSFCRNNITISVHDFVYIMAEDGKRLIAYIEDLYEDIRGKNMVVVRWFHKADEVRTPLPPDVNDREIFFSLILQHLSVECIDGLAAVLSAHDFDKFHNETKQKVSPWEPYLCRRQIDNDDIKAIDIAQVQGYWSQEVLRSVYATTSGTSLKLRLKIPNGLSGPKKKKQRLNEDVNATGVVRDVNKSRVVASNMMRKQLIKQKLRQQQPLTRGSQVEVLSQSSGIRGCWYRGVVIKRHRDKVKVQYLDIQDADNDGNLEEWIVASRIASPDKLGIRMDGRFLVRPKPSHATKFSCKLGVGSVVDAWWNDGWWEGIIIKTDSEEKHDVYFPGEKQVSTFIRSDLRPSLEWMGKRWKRIKDFPDVASMLLSDTNKENMPVVPLNQDLQSDIQKTSTTICTLLLSGELPVLNETEDAAAPNLVRELDGLHWNKYRKRKHIKEPKCKRQQFGSSSSSSSVDPGEEYNSKEACKIGGDLTFTPPLPLCPNLVMSQ